MAATEARVSTFQSSKQKANRHVFKSVLDDESQFIKGLLRMRKDCGALAYNFFASQFVLPQESRAFGEELQRTGDDRWLVKPCPGCWRTSIWPAHLLQAAARRGRILVQRFIDRPCLLDGHKFDINVFAAVTSLSPWRMYLYDEGFVRIHPEIYTTGTPNGRCQAVHLQPAVPPAANIPQVTWSLSQLWAKLEEMRISPKHVASQIRDTVIKTFVSIDKKVNSVIGPHDMRAESFQLRMLLDASGRIWLTSVQTAPGIPVVPQLSHITEEFDRLAAPVTAGSGAILDKYIYRAGAEKMNEEEVIMLYETDQEYNQRGRFERIFPSSDSPKYLGLLDFTGESSRRRNFLVVDWVLKCATENEKKQPSPELKRVCPKELMVEISFPTVQNKREPKSLSPGKIIRSRALRRTPSPEPLSDDRALIKLSSPIALRPMKGISDDRVLEVSESVSSKDLSPPAAPLPELLLSCSLAGAPPPTCRSPNEKEHNNVSAKAVTEPSHAGAPNMEPEMHLPRPASVLKQTSLMFSLPSRISPQTATAAAQRAAYIEQEQSRLRSRAQERRLRQDSHQQLPSVSAPVVSGTREMQQLMASMEMRRATLHPVSPIFSLRSSTVSRFHSAAVGLSSNEPLSAESIRKRPSPELQHRRAVSVPRTVMHASSEYPVTLTPELSSVHDSLSEGVSPTPFLLNVSNSSSRSRSPQPAMQTDSVVGDTSPNAHTESPSEPLESGDLRSSLPHVRRRYTITQGMLHRTAAQQQAKIKRERRAADQQLKDYATQLGQEVNKQLQQHARRLSAQVAEELAQRRPGKLSALLEG